MSIMQCEIITLPKLTDPRGNLTFVESFSHIPFSIERVYYLYDVPGGVSRGGHAHKNLQQVIIAVHGSFDVLIDDGKNKKVVTLNRSNEGLLVKSFIWRELLNFSSGSVCLVIASEKYSEDDYIRSYDEFQNIVNEPKK
jgi:dTDP-4-dehydrorhamnose 3,5-epimerase-like enzyme